MDDIDPGRRGARVFPRRSGLTRAARWASIVGIALTSLAACSGGGVDIEGLEKFSDLTRQHVETPVAYEQSPPVGGDHAPIWQNCGFYDEPVPDEQAVHSLEHGAVWLAYDPRLAEDMVDALRELARAEERLLVAPYPDLDAPVVATAWGRQVELESPDDPRLEEFIDALMGDAGRAPEPDAPCTDGRGSPA